MMRRHQAASAAGSLYLTVAAGTRTIRAAIARSPRANMRATYMVAESTGMPSSVAAFPIPTAKPANRTMKPAIPSGNAAIT
jgi:hypothetical protein